MVSQLPKPAVICPDNDGRPMSDNTLQFSWIVKVKENLEILFADNLDVFVAGDLLWYPVEGSNTTKRAPDAMVAFGRPKGYRGSYMQSIEDDIAPQIVFETLSPGNRLAEMTAKFEFYNKYGVEEYYIYDPDKVDFTGCLRQKTKDQTAKRAHLSRVSLAGHQAKQNSRRNVRRRTPIPRNRLWPDVLPQSTFTR
jgi:Uma2 family endonuclease